MYHNSEKNNLPHTGISYEDINWYDVMGQPFGAAMGFNAIVFGDMSNIVDTKGGMAIGGNFTSSRGLSLGFGNDGKLQDTGYSPDKVVFLTGGNVAMQGPLVVVGHVVTEDNFQAAKGSTYMIGKDGTKEQVQTLTGLYYADNGNRYWRVSDRNDHYIISSYDVPRYIPSERIGADVSKFFSDAKRSITQYHNCITAMEPNGAVTEHYHEWILSGNDPEQNVFVIDTGPNGLLNKEIRFDIPEDSLGIVVFRTGPDAHLQYGLWGEEAKADHVLYVFEDAKKIYMEVPAAIWGSILAPQAMFYAHQTGGTVSGNAALGGFVVGASSGFEFHLYPFVGGVACGENSKKQPSPQPAPQPTPIPSPQPAPKPVPQPAPRPAPQPSPQPAPKPMPQRPEQRPMQEPVQCPVCPPCPKLQPCPPCPKAQPCPPCPDNVTKIFLEPVPIPIPYKEAECPPVCPIEAGLIFGCIWGCSCCSNHDWEVKLYRGCAQDKKLIGRARLNCCGCFEFRVPYDDYYIISVCPIDQKSKSVDCKPVLALKNIGVKSLMLC